MMTTDMSCFDGIDLSKRLEISSEMHPDTGEPNDHYSVILINDKPYKANELELAEKSPLILARVKELELFLNEMMVDGFSFRYEQHNRTAKALLAKEWL